MTKQSAAICRRNSRVDRYRQLVRPIALHYSRRCNEPLDDLIQVGLMGLLRAAERYDTATATPFEAFARPHIRGAILHYLRDQVQVIRIPRPLMDQLSQRRRCLREAEVALGCSPSGEQLRQAMGLSTEQWHDLERANQLRRLQPLLPGELETAEAIASTDSSDVHPESLGLALEALASLEPPLADVVRRVVLAGWSYRRTAQLLAISPMTVQRRLHRGLAELRERLVSLQRPLRHPAASAAPAC